MSNEVKKVLTLDGLTRFKTKQDQFNASTYIPLTQKAAANGVATLDANGLVPSSQLPSYVDDVLGYANLAAFPETGETGKIYVDRATGKIYRWVDPVEADPEDPEDQGAPGAYINISSAVSVADAAIKLQTARRINTVLFDGTADITLPTADAAGAGALAGTVIVGTNIDLANDGTISVATADASTLGLVQVGTNIDVSSGVISVKTGSDSDLGLVKVGDNITVGTGNDAGTISITASNVEDALGYEVVDITNAEIDALFA